MPDSPRSLGDERTQAGLPSEAASPARSLGDQSTHAEGVSSVSDLGALAANLDETLELTDLAARYELGAVIGRGGMGEVLLARDKRLERPVAIKRILGEGARSATALRRFLTEARSLAQLNHFNIVQVFDYGRDREGPFLILEYVAGKSLQEKLKAGPLPTEQAVDMVCQLCDGLSAAHERGIIHRDVKPANVLLTERGEPKLTDFGLAHRESRDGERTQAGAVLGTIDFMPPEQRRDATQADARSDLWSLAATLYQMLTGKSPKVIRLDQVPETLRPVLGKALEEEPAERYPTTAEFKTALRAASALLRSTPPQPSEAVLVEGVCPQCKTQNDLSRKFCKSCRSSLTVECLSCRTVIKVWEDVCGECGASQQEQLAQRRTVTNSLGMQLTLIPAGEFLMGSPAGDTDAEDDEKPQHKVRITKPYYLGIHEVTQGQWKAVMGSEPWNGQNHVQEGPDYPATYVSWEDAAEFCKKLSAKEGKTYRLPTEAEWEYACRAGTTTKHSFGDDNSRLGEYAWYDKNAKNIGEEYAHVVGQKKPNAWGLYDMHGNVWEWCSDWYGDKYYGASPASDPPGPVRGSYRVNRGGSWDLTPAFCRSAYRFWDTPDYRSSNLGFRPALVP